MAQLAINSITRAGQNISSPNPFVAVSGGGDKFTNTGKEFVYLTNLNGGTVTLTVQTPGTIDGLAVTDLTYAAATGANHVLGPFPMGVYNDANGDVNLSYSATTGVTIAIFRLTPAN